MRLSKSQFSPLETVCLRNVERCGHRGKLRRDYRDIISATRKSFGIDVLNVGPVFVVEMEFVSIAIINQISKIQIAVGAQRCDCQSRGFISQERASAAVTAAGNDFKRNLKGGVCPGVAVWGSCSTGPFLR